MHLVAYDAPMPAKNPRLTVTLPLSLSLKLRRMSEVTGSSQSSIVAELLTQAEPVFERLVAVLEAAQTAQMSLRTEAVESLDRAQTVLEQQLGLALDVLDSATGNLLEPVEKVRGRARRGVRAGGAAHASRRARLEAGQAAKKAVPDAVLTPLSNRGVRSDPKTVKKLTTTRVYVDSDLEGAQTPKVSKKRAKKGG